MYQAIIMQPIINGLQSLSRYTGIKYGPKQSVIMIGITAIQGTIIFIEVSINESPIILTQGSWINSGYQNQEWSLNFDTLSTSMQLPILWISFCVQMYSQNYMDGENHINRFYSYLSLFSFFMQLQVTSDNLQILFIGWEGVGLISYQLVGFYFTRVAANQAAIKAFLMNRIGDMGLFLGLLFCITLLGDTSFSGLWILIKDLNSDQIFIQAIAMVIGAIAKSAQFGLHSWLLAAMEGPTPVSALQHSATMVTAGVYLQIRCSPQQEYSSTSLIIITWFGGLSALQGAANGLMENDQKKIIAFSTTSQQGYMMVAVGLSQYNQGLFHLQNHASFKALQFLSAGAIIHAISDIQDIRKMGSFIISMPITSSYVLLASLSLMAFPFFTGFYSKDVLLELALIPRNTTSTMAYIFTLIAAIQTATYSVRLMILTFLSKPHFPNYKLSLFILDPPIFMFIPMTFLAIGSLIWGYITHDMFMGLGSTFYQHAIFIHPNNIHLLDNLITPLYLKFLPGLTLFILILLIPSPLKGFHNTSQPPTREAVRGIPGQIPGGSGLWLFSAIQTHIEPMIYNRILISYANFGLQFSRYFDQGLIEIIGPLGFIRIFHYYAFII